MLRRARRRGLRRVGEESEEDRGREQNGGMDADVVRLVLAEHLVRRLRGHGGRGSLSANQRAQGHAERERTSPRVTAIPSTDEELLLFAFMWDLQGERNVQDIQNAVAF